MKVVMLGWFYDPKNLHPVNEAVRRYLADSSITLVVANAWSDSFASADLIIVAHPVADRPAFSEARLLGQRTINRFQRLAIAEKTGATVAPFGSPISEAELTRLSETWPDGAVLKYDWSAKRKGIFFWPLDANRMEYPERFRPDADVFMKFLPSDPVTYKVDAFGGTIMGTWILPSRDMREEKWQWIAAAPMERFNAPPDLLDEVRKTSAALLRFGVGHASFDYMRSNDGFALIEINSCGVGAEAWDTWPELYGENLSAAILRVLDQREVIPKYEVLRPLAQSAGNEQDVQGNI